MTLEELTNWMEEGSIAKVANITFEKKDGVVSYDKYQEIVDSILADLGPIESINDKVFFAQKPPMKAKPLCIFKVRDDIFIVDKDLPASQAIWGWAYPTESMEPVAMRNPKGPWAQLVDNYIVFSIPASEEQKELVVIEVLNAEEADVAKFENLKKEILENLLKK